MFEKIILQANQAKACFRYYKLHIRLTKVIQKIKFNKNCLYNNITPKYTIINIKNTNHITNKTKIYAEKFRIINEIKFAHYQKNKINLDIYEMNLYLLKMLGQLTHDIIKELIINKINIIKRTINEKHNKKINELKNFYNKKPNHKYRERKSINFIKRRIK